jgi:hypothetical protein
MCSETSNLVAETLGRDQGDLVADFLVGLEVEGKTGVVLFNQDTGSLLDGFGSDATLLAREPDELESLEMHRAKAEKIEKESRKYSDCSFYKKKKNN